MPKLGIGKIALCGVMVMILPVQRLVSCSEGSEGRILRPDFIDQMMIQVYNKNSDSC